MHRCVTWCRSFAKNIYNIMTHACDAQTDMIWKEKESVKHECVSKEQKEAFFLSPLTPYTSQRRGVHT